MIGIKTIYIRLLKNKPFFNEVNKMQFSKELLALWGKKKAYENNQFYWLPVMAHLIDTGNIIKYL